MAHGLLEWVRRTLKAATVSSDVRSYFGSDLTAGLFTPTFLSVCSVLLWCCELRESWDGRTIGYSASVSIHLVFEMTLELILGWGIRIVGGCTSYHSCSALCPGTRGAKSEETSLQSDPNLGYSVLRLSPKTFRLDVSVRSPQWAGKRFNLLFTSNREGRHW